MPQAFTMLWSRDRCSFIRRDAGKPLSVLFGGVHTSAPSLISAGVGPGDIVFPVSIKGGALHLIAAAVVHEYVSLEDYVVQELGYPRESIKGLHSLQIFDLLEGAARGLGHRMPYGCGTEVALVSRATTIRFDTIVPAEDLERVIFAPRKGPPIGLTNIANGKLASSASLQGHVRRLSFETAEMFANIIGFELPI